MKIPKRLKYKKTLNEKDWDALEKLLDKATNKELYLVLDLVQYEIRLSEQCIKEGFEK